MKTLTYREFMELARQNYCNGGEVFYECWEEYQFDDYAWNHYSSEEQGFEICGAICSVFHMLY